MNLLGKERKQRELNDFPVITMASYSLHASAPMTLTCHSAAQPSHTPPAPADHGSSGPNLTFQKYNTMLALNNS